nr:ornithine cyclodeaminase family protein [Kibdelosporangium sp. MJ126-NF4]CEL12677.1 Ornithine cyclodeaminase [Kibdelosporangium sp. MJ126-NF4]CTQ93541.1 Ornithine cyclodeaminase (EC 4.3.1.12) [Kibdelosporangium sp. MJ126-NF4]
MTTLWFEADAIRAAVGFQDLLDPVAAALTDFSRGLGESPVSVFAPAGRDGDVHVKSAWLPGSSVFVVKVATWFAERARRGDTPGGGLIAVFDAQTGDPVAMLRDEHHLSDVRTAAAGGLAARLLSRANSTTVGVLGTGAQAYLQVLAVAAERPIRTVNVWGRRAESVQRMASALRSRRPDLFVVQSPTARDACAEADVLITATASTSPLVEPDWLAPGTHITAVGADDTEKVELAPGCVARADRIVVDSRELASVYGDLAHATRSGVPSTPDELGEVLAGDVVGRTDDEQITLCKLIGLGVQDLAAATVALRHLAEPDPAAARPASALDLRC